ncbi:hypothetical protein ACS0TY_029191 [Phlomoides rotata]
MAPKYSSGFLLIILIILIALECSSAKCYKGHVDGGERKDESEHTFVLGRKLLQGMKGKSIDFQERSESLDAENSLPVPQMESNRIPAQKIEGSKEFVEAADEVATLMRKDYKGEGRPRRKPPINNHEPHN